MSLLDWINPLGKAMDIADKFVVDKDKQIELRQELEKLRENVYLKELETKTVPWVDGLHKMARTILSFSAMLAGIILIHSGVTDPLTIAAIMAPAGIYTGVKGRGNFSGNNNNK